MPLTITASFAPVLDDTLMTAGRRLGEDGGLSEEYESVEVVSREAWRQWLSEHHDSSPGVWLVRYKKADGHRHVAYNDVVEEALCFGWVDSRPRKLDDARSKLLVTPRKRGSGWSRANKQRIARLEEDGLIKAAGRAALEAAKKDGSWSALDAVENLEEPDELRDALDASEDARRNWDEFPRSVKRGILEWIGSAKREATREKRVRETAELAARGERANQWRRPAH